MAHVQSGLRRQGIGFKVTIPKIKVRTKQFKSGMQKVGVRKNLARSAMRQAMGGA